MNAISFFAKMCRLAVSRFGDTPLLRFSKYTRTQGHVHTYILACTHLSFFVRLVRFMHLSVYIPLNTHGSIKLVCSCARVLCVCVCVCACIYSYLGGHIFAHKYIYIYICIYVYTYVYIYRERECVCVCNYIIMKFFNCNSGIMHVCMYACMHVQTF